MTNLGDDRVAVVARHEVLYFAGRSIFQLVTTDEMVCELVLRGVGGAAVHDGDGAVGLLFGTVSVDLSHAVVGGEGERQKLVGDEREGGIVAS